MLLVPRALADRLCVDADLAAVVDERRPHELTLRIQVHLRADHAECPRCGQRAVRVHSSYERTLADLALQGIAARLAVRVRRFRCDQPDCPRRTFVEPLTGLAAPRARRTERLATMQTQVGMALGGAASARLLPSLGASVSASTVLRLLHHAQVATPPTPRVLGVDDWAIRRGHHYGTVLIDLETHRPVDLLPDREVETLARWLKEHPGVEILTRDRAEVYAEGARQGAPNAMQVADRWHLLKNVGEVLERILHHHRSALRDAADAVAEPSQSASSDVLSATPEPTSALPTKASALAAARRAHREALYEQIHALRTKRVSIHAIGQQLGVSRATVRKYVRSSTCPTRAPRRTQITSLSTFDAHLRERWAQGFHDAMALWRELKSMGFKGSHRTVQRHVQSWSTVPDAYCPPRRPKKTCSTQPTSQTPAMKPPSPRLAVWWLLLPSSRLSLEQCQFVDHLTEQCAPIRGARELAAEFGQIVRSRQHAALPLWLEEASASEHAEFRDFAASLRRDLAAVEAAVREPWSNGQTEGQVNKIKMLKRQMYGRASVVLLRQRLLFAA